MNRIALGALALTLSFAGPAWPAKSPYAFSKGYPPPEASAKARDGADYERAVTAYRFWYPAVSVEGIFNGNRVAGIEDNKAMRIGAAGPLQVGFTLNSDTPYGSAALDLTDGPMVVEVPAGGETYRPSVPQPVPNKLLLSVTAYDAQTRSEVQTDQRKAALRSLFELKDVVGDGSIDLYFGPAAPAGQEERWIKTEPGRGWFAYMRVSGPEQAAFDGSWKPADFIEVK